MSGLSTIETQGVGALHELVLPYAGAVKPDEAARLGGHAGGIVLSGRRGVSTARVLRAQGYEGSLLIDPALYVGVSDPTGNEAREDRLFTGADWLAAQRELRVATLLTPCRPITVGATEELAEAIAEGNKAAERSDVPIMTVLALPAGWLRAPHFESLLAGLQKAATPIAFALGHSNDPLGTQGAIGAILRALRLVPGSALIRSDIAALGAFAHGSPFGAIGLGTSQRHFVPPGSRAGGNREDTSVRLFVPGLMTYRSANLLGSVAGRDREGVLRCHCFVCQGESLERFEDDRLRSLAREHDVLAWRDILNRLLSVRPAMRKGAWRQICFAAIERHGYLEETTNVAFPVPAHLRAWERFSTMS